ncbi:ABC transporter permease [Cellulosimicrobium composti]|uniref:ABC transporter permease n=1 Tax=Cellulosimicrobium composti TaxID=2672572 RepID=A0A6N7ZER6_9MICO|nr:ABC transporter permease [Cellulosimicrobium composti]MTG87802.1 ABC transporter permease [Cellulosimicrobium composti]NDO89258.1 ABC transporter permease [Cellulosimicrobium composti]TWG85117.1 ribose transport system permease protein [Cellulosimicrobium cellulans J34]SME91997.1 ribose transport system permease protein [Cellulosimicrobium cellulans J1]
MTSTTTVTDALPDAVVTSRGPRYRQQLQQILAFAGLVVIFAFFSVASPYFLDWANIKGILLATAVTGIMALGATFVIATGGIDLSVGTGMTLCAVMTGVFLTNLGLPLAVGVLGGIAAGALLGLVNGLNVSFLGIPPFIATLATMMVAQGLSLVISGTKPIYFSDVAGFGQIALGELVPGLPNAVLIFFVAAVVAGVLLSKSLVGRYALSIGSNEEATAISGIDVRRWKVVVYTVAGVFTGLAGVVMASRLNSAQPGLGLGYELEAIAAVVIGGTSLRGGKATILGTVIGALIMATLTNGLRIMSIPQEWQKVAVGVVILLAVYTDILRRGKDA